MCASKANHNLAAKPSWELRAVLGVFLLALVEAVWGLLTWPFIWRKEKVHLTCTPTAENKTLLEKLRKLRHFACCPWAAGPHAQTFFSLIHTGTRPLPRKELVTMPDGVQVTLLWFEPKDAPSDAPVIVSLHGIGGDENSVRPVMLAEECLRRGWPSVMYVRRGHGESSLLPVGVTVPPSASKAAGEVEVDRASSVSESVLLMGAAHKSPHYYGPQLPSERDSVATLGQPEPRGPSPDAAAASMLINGELEPQSDRSVHGPGAAAAAATATAAATAATDAAADLAAGAAVAAAATSGSAPASPAAVSGPASGPATSPASRSSLDSLAACLPRNLNLPTVNLPNVNLPHLNLPNLPSLPTLNLPNLPSLPTLNLPPVNFHSLGWPGWPGWPGWQAQPGTPVAPSVAGASSALTDRDSLLRVRKAFPQHADTEDFHAVLRHIRAARPQAPMLAVGFSMGSNVLVKYLGEYTVGEQRPAAQEHSGGDAAGGAAGAAAGGGVEGSGGQPGAAGGSEDVDEEDRNPLLAAISVCNGYDIVEGTRELVSRRPLADRIITGALHRLLRRRLPEVHAICAAHGLLVDFDEVLACSTLHEFERALMLPICGVADLDAYYERNNCREALQHVSVPLLCLSARDDPIISARLLRHAEEAAAANPHLLLAVTRRGGHLGWMAGWRGRSWMMEVIMEYIEAALQRQVGAGGGAAVGSGYIAPAVVAAPEGDVAVEVRQDGKARGADAAVEVSAASGTAALAASSAAEAAVTREESVGIAVGEEEQGRAIAGGAGEGGAGSHGGMGGGRDLAGAGACDGARRDGRGQVVIQMQE